MFWGYDYILAHLGIQMCYWYIESDRTCEYVISAFSWLNIVFTLSQEEAEEEVKEEVVFNKSQNAQMCNKSLTSRLWTLISHNNEVSIKQVAC